MKQKVPSSLDEAVSHTLQVEAFLAASRIAAAGYPDEPELSTNAVHTKMNTREDKLLLKLGPETTEDKIAEQKSRSQSQQPKQQSRDVTCYRCGQAGHYAQGCALPKDNKPRHSGN